MSTLHLLVAISLFRSGSAFQATYRVNAGVSSSTSDVLSWLEDKPQGAYLEELGPVVQAISLSYYSVPGPEAVPSMANDTISIEGQHWERLFELDRDPVPGGVRARVFVERSRKRAILAFRGSCLDDNVEQCWYDLCVLRTLKSFGGVSNLTYHMSDNALCGKLGGEQLVSDYLQQADEYARTVQAYLPGVDLLLVGHSMGGWLSMVTAARQPGVLKALTFAPTPFHDSLLQKLGWSEQQIQQLPSADLVAVCDPYDCGINALYVSTPRKGAQTCLYLSLPPTEKCEEVPAQPYGDEKWRETLKPSLDIFRTVTVLNCKGSAHAWSHYEEFALATDSEGHPLHLPKCSTDFSVLQSLYLQGQQVST